MKFSNHHSTVLRFCQKLLLATSAIPFLSIADALPAKPADFSPGLKLAHELNDAFTEISRQASDSVVVINVTEKISTTSNSADGFDEYEDPWEKFRRFFDKKSPDRPPEKSTGQGSGVIIRKNGYIITNQHVVQDADKVEVRLKDGRIFKGEVRGQDVPADVAVIKIEADELPVAKLGNSDKTRIGEFAIAIGAPFSLEYSTTFGHVSAKNRSNLGDSADEVNGLQDQDFIQTDASINPGNSGGPLVNIDGEVIGINTLIRGIHTGIGFAIPINLAKDIADKLIQEGKFPRSWLGIGIKSLREYPEYRELLPNSTPDGVVVSEIALGGPAAKSALQVEDIILSIDGKQVLTSQHLHQEIRTKPPGKEVSLEVFRRGGDGGKRLRLSLLTEEWKDSGSSATDENSTPEGKAALLDPLGITVKSLTTDQARKIGVEVGEGVIISKAAKTGVGYLAGLGEGDIITAIDGHKVNTLRTYHGSLLHADLGKGCIVQFISQGSRRFEILRSDTN